MTTVLLDLDGVLMDHLRAALEAVRGWLGERATPEVVDAWFVAQDQRTAEAIGARKPDPRAFLITCDRLGVAPDSVLSVGDEFEVDVVGARSAGLHAVLLDRSGTAPPEETAVIHSLRARAHQPRRGSPAGRRRADLPRRRWRRRWWRMVL